jgi:tRNA A-37 threonylcarbamoyl transferase component Bud32
MVDTQPTIVADVLIGKTIGNYVVRRQLGQGGMGAVYLAEHPAIGKQIALKVLNPELAAQPEIVNRFFNEAKAVNEIRHPNIVDIIDFGLLPAGGPADPPIVYFLMEFIDGTSLTELLRREAPLPWARASAIALQIADALAASHRKGIIHRDLKSDNVMLVSRGREHDFIKLLDFGIAKLTGNPSNTHRTRTGMLMGTPQYMSPEQCEGRSSIDHRTDVYSLGILLYQMLTGSVPFGGDTFGEVLMQQMAIPPLAPSLIAPQIPEHVELIVLKALEKSADLRYARMEDMILALQDPRRYVEARGGSAGFLISPVLRDPALAGSKAAMALIASATGRAASTTLGGSAAQATAAPAKRGMSGIGKLAIAAGTAAIVIAGLVVAARRDPPRVASHPAAESSALSPPIAPPSPPAVPPAAVDPSPSPQPVTSESEPAPRSPPTAPVPPSPATAPAPVVPSRTSAAPSKPSPPVAAAPRARPAISIAIESAPPGARVFVGSESTARGTTPFVLELAADAAATEIRLVRAGYQPLKRTVDPARDSKLMLALEKLAGSTPPIAKPARPTGERDDSDEMMDPFANKQKKDAP